MKTISLYNSDKVAYIDDDDDEDLERCSKLRWRLGNGQVISQLRFKLKPLHRFILRLKSPSIDNCDVDHINGDILDNRKVNLRVCSRSQNLRNSRKHSDGYFRYKGLSINKYKKSNNIKCRIFVNGKEKNLGYFSCPIEAAIAYDDAAILYFGEFAKLNFPLYGA